MSSVMRKAMVYLGLSDDEYDDYERRDDAREPAMAGSRSGVDYSRGTTSIRPLTRPESAAAPRPTVVRSVEPVSDAPVKVHVIEPVEFSDAQEIGDRLRENQPVIVTINDVDADLARRLIDFCSGATYVLSGSMERVAKNVFLLTPANVEVPSEEKQRLRERGLYRS